MPAIQQPTSFQKGLERVEPGGAGAELPEQMGTSVKMIEEHYGHVNTVKHADLVLQDMGGWDPDATVGETQAGADKASRILRAKAKTAEPGGKLRRRSS